jgi:class 3 adenylate cyclase/tetratricopeptide (TPR) repeat protein
MPEGSRFCPACGAPVSAAAVTGERRKVVTVVFADVVGSTALGERVDSETLRWAMQRWFVRMRDVVESHGGTVENYIGDAVMAVFGIPVAHEDDALRAVRAAAAMREQVAALGDELRAERGVDLRVRIGVNTGEAVTGDAAAGGFFTAGDIVNVAARLEQSARPGDILVGTYTFRLVRHAVEVEQVAPLTVKGKADALAAYRLLRVAPDAPGRPRRERSPLVDRQRERGQLVGAFDQAVRDRSCQLLTVLGAAGVGKSRIVAEVTDALGDAATVAAGRCLPYGDGLTWWPLVEALGNSGLFEQVAGTGEPAIARAGELLKPKGDPVAPEEAFWAVRRVLETLARRQPVVLVIDDLHWAEPTFMDLLEHVADWVHDAPLLLVVMARPDLLDVRPAWGASRPNATSVLVEPLDDDEAADLLRHLVGTATLGGRATTRILEVAEGNPLFVEEVVAMLIDDGLLSTGNGNGTAREPTAIAVPPTIQVLLAARLDRLAPNERAVVEAASVEGKEFTRERVAALVPDDVRPSIGALLRTLVRKDIIRPVGADADTFRFRHQLTRDAAYEGMSKELRAELHERFADWLEARPEAFPLIFDELLGYHLERAVRLRRELGESDEATAELAARASAHLGTAGRRAGQRDDPSAASTLLERAAALVEADDAALGALLPALGASLFEAGRMAEAISILDEAIARAPDPRLEARARIEREFVRLESEARVGTERARRVADEALPVLEREGDDAGQCRAWYLRAQAAWIAGRVGRADEAWCEAAECARRAHDDRELFRILGMRATAAVLGPTPVHEAIHRCEQFRELVGASPVAAALMVNPLASLHAMRGEFELADRFLAEANETLDQLGSLGWVSHHEALVRLLERRPGLAEVPLREAVERLAAMGSGELLATTLAMLAQAVFAQGQLQEAEQLCRMAAGAGAHDDIVTQVISRGVRAKIVAEKGDADEAEALARDAVALVAPTDLLSHRGDAMLDLAEVLGATSHTDEYHEVVQAALLLYEEKGNLVGAARARALLANRIRGT